MKNPFRPTAVWSLVCIILLSSAVVYAQVIDEPVEQITIENEAPIISNTDLPTELLSRTAKLIKGTTIATNEQLQTITHQKEVEDRLGEIYNLLRKIEQNTRKE
jgi:hypothetical protein